MWDLPPNTSDNYIQQEQLTPNTQIEHRLNEYPQMSKEVWDIVIKVKNGVVKIVKKAEISWNTQSETKELKEELIKKVEVILTPEEIEAIWWKIIAIFQWDVLIKYEIWENEIIDVTKIDINNDFWNLLSKKVSNSFFERLENWEIIWHKMDGQILNQNNNNFHKVFYMDYYRLKKPINY